jgi:uncharacterized phage infection (PIP) family protein YhgE
MKSKLAVCRLGVILLFLLGMVGPVAATGAGATAQAVSCDDFRTREEAQEALEDDPDTAETLDEDGDGIACEDLPTEAEATSDDGVKPEDVQLPGDDDGATEEATAEDDEPTEEATEEATAEDDAPTEEATAEDDASGGDVDEYLATIQGEVDGLQESVDRFNEINAIATGGDATTAELQDLADEANEIAATWAEYPDVAAEITATAPDGVEEIDTAYQDLAETTGQAGEEWAVYWDTPSDSAEEDEAFEAFNETFVTMQDQLDELNLLLEGDGDATPEATEESSEEGEAYIATIQDEVDTLQTSLDDFSAAIETARDDASSDTERDDAIDELNGIAEDWAEYPEIAAEITAPDGFEEIDTAYQDLAAEVGEMGDNWTLFWEAEVDSPEEDEAREAFDENFENVQTQIDDLNTLLEDAAGGDDATAEATEEPTEEATEEATEEPTEDATEEPSGDADEYLTAVRDNADELSESIDRFNEIVAAGNFTDEEVTEVGEILQLWAEAPDVAAGLDAPSEFSEIDDTYVELTEELATASESFIAYGQADSGSPEADEALQDFQDALDNAETLAADLDELLTAEGV